MVLPSAMLTTQASSATHIQESAAARIGMVGMCNVAQLNTQPPVDGVVALQQDGTFIQVGMSAHTVNLIMWAPSAQVTVGSTVAMTTGIMWNVIQSIMTPRGAECTVRACNVWTDIEWSLGPIQFETAGWCHRTPPSVNYSVDKIMHTLSYSKQQTYRCIRIHTYTYIYIYICL